MKSYTNDDKIREQCLARILYEGDMSSARKEGMLKGQNRLNQLVQFLIRDDRLDDLARSATDQAFQDQLFKEYGL